MLYFADTICLLLQEKNGVGKANLKYFNVSHIWKEEQPQYQHTMHLTRQQILLDSDSLTNIITSPRLKHRSHSGFSPILFLKSSQQVKTPNCYLFLIGSHSSNDAFKASVNTDQLILRNFSDNEQSINIAPSLITRKLRQRWVEGQAKSTCGICCQWD